MYRLCGARVKRVLRGRTTDTSNPTGVCGVGGTWPRELGQGFKKQLVNLTSVQRFLFLEYNHILKRKTQVKPKPERA